MNRRDLLRTLGAAAAATGANVLSPHPLEAQVKPATPAPFAVPIRGLLVQKGREVQPIQITAPAITSPAELTVSIDGVVVDRRQAKAQEVPYMVYVPAVAWPKTVHVELTGAGSSPLQTIVQLKAVRRTTIYILPHSHHDLGYTDFQPAVEEKQMDNITRGIELARKTADYPEGARFVWNLEVLWATDLYFQRRSKSQQDELIDAIRKGWIALNGAYANELTGLCRPEELLRLFRYGAHLGKRLNVPVNAAMMSDVPGYTWGTIDAMAQAGIRYFSAAPNMYDRIGTFMVTWEDRPFWWVSPSGQNRVLTWVPWTGYAMSHGVKHIDAAWCSGYQDRLDAVHFPYDISCIRWSGHGDNAVPDTDLPEFARSWNETYTWPKFRISSTSEAFSAMEQAYGNQLPSFQGDLTPYWEDGAASSALETHLSRNASDRLTQAEILAAVRGGAFDDKTWNEAWRNVLMYSEHTWGAWTSVIDPDVPFVTKQWEFKRQFAVRADEQSRSLLASTLASATDPAEGHIAVWNTAPWERTEVVLVAKNLSADGDRVLDHKGRPVPSQRLSSGELAFLANNATALGSSLFRVVAGHAEPPREAASATQNELRSATLTVKLNPATGDISELRRNDNNSGNVAAGPLNQYVLLEGDDLNQLQYSGAPTITVVENGPLVAELRVQSSAPATKGLTRSVRLTAGADHIELANLVDKTRSPRNPKTGDNPVANEFSQHGGKESLQFGFPFNVPGARMTMKEPLAVMRPEQDQLPGSNKNWLPVGSWIDIAGPDGGCTWVTLDAPLVELGEISADLLGSQKDPDVWRRTLYPTQTIYSWVMNNHWETNYRAYQEGPVEFRYAVALHGAGDASTADRFGVERTQPLLVEALASRAEEKAAASLFRIEPAGLRLVALKPSDDGHAWIVTLLRLNGGNGNLQLHWSRPVGRTWISNTAEDRVAELDPGHTLRQGEIITLRVDRPNSSA